MDYKKIKTSEEVYATLMRQHFGELRVFSTFSAPDGDYFGDPNVCRMMTEYGFDNTDIPILGIETTWDRQVENTYERVNEQHKYWLCIGVSD